MLLPGDALSSDAALAGPSFTAKAEEAQVDDDTEAANINQADRTAMDALDAIQLHDAEAERQLQELLESSRVAEQEAGAALEDEADEVPQARRVGSSPISPAGSRAMLKSQLWEQQVCLTMPSSFPTQMHTMSHRHAVGNSVDQNVSLTPSISFLLVLPSSGKRPASRRTNERTALYAGQVCVRQLVFQEMCDSNFSWQAAG